MTPGGRVARHTESCCSCRREISSKRTTSASGHDDEDEDEEDDEEEVEEEEEEEEEEVEEEVEEEEEEAEAKEEKPQKKYPTYNYRDVLRYYPRPTSGFHYTAVVLRSGKLADCIHSRTKSLEVRFDTIEDWIASLKDKGDGQEELYVNMYSYANEKERDAQRANWRDGRCKANAPQEK